MNEFENAFVPHEFFNRVEVPTELFFFGDQFVNFLVAIFADGNRFIHLLAREVLLEPFVLVAGSGDQVMFRCSGFGKAVAKAAGNWIRVLF